MNRGPGISFCIITGGSRPDRMEALIHSIVRMGVPRHEILVCGKYHPDPRVEYAERKEWAENAEVNRMRNFNAARARFDTVVVLDDDVEFTPGWWEAVKGKTGFDLAGCRGLDPMGNRWWDWNAVEPDNPLSAPALLDYSRTHPNAYISGYFMMMRWEVWNDVRFDETRRNYQHDDIDFCRRAKAKGWSLGIFPDATVIHHVDPRGREENDRARAEFIARRSKAATDEERAARHLALKEYAKAAALYAPLAVDGSFANLYNLAYCLEMTGDRTGALAAFRRAAATPAAADPARRAAALFHAGGLLLEQGELAEAAEALKQALALNPEHKRAALMLAQLEAAKTAQ